MKRLIVIGTSTIILLPVIFYWLSASPSLNKAPQIFALSPTTYPTSMPAQATTLPASPETMARDIARGRVPVLAAQLKNGTQREREQAITEIQHMADSMPRAMADGLPDWIDLLVDLKQFDDVQKLTKIAIAEKAYDVPTVERAQRARVLSFLNQGNPDQALAEAKSYYNVATLRATREAVGFLVDAISKTLGPEVTARFKAGQNYNLSTISAPLIRPASSQPDSSEASMSATSELLRPGPESASVLRTIKVDSALYESTIRDLEMKKSSTNEYSRPNLIARGNLLLLADRPAEARKCFEQGCAVDGTRRTLHFAVEGIARAIRAEAGNVATADAFILDLRRGVYTGSQALSALGDAQKDSLRAVAKQTPLSADNPSQSAGN